MKKIIFAVMAVAAIGFTSCGNKTQQGEAADPAAVATEQEATDAIIADEAQDGVAGIISEIETKEIEGKESESLKEHAEKKAKEVKDAAEQKGKEKATKAIDDAAKDVKKGLGL